MRWAHTIFPYQNQKYLKTTKQVYNSNIQEARWNGWIKKTTQTLDSFNNKNNVKIVMQKFCALVQTSTKTSYKEHLTHLKKGRLEKSEYSSGELRMYLIGEYYLLYVIRNKAVVSYVGWWLTTQSSMNVVIPLFKWWVLIIYHCVCGKIKTLITTPSVLNSSTSLLEQPNFRKVIEFACVQFFANGVIRWNMYVDIK